MAVAMNDAVDDDAELAARARRLRDALGHLADDQRHSQKLFERHVARLVAAAGRLACVCNEVIGECSCGEASTPRPTGC